MDDALVSAVVHDDELGDGKVFEHVERVGDHVFRADRFRVFRHDVARVQTGNRVAARQHSSDVAVGNDADDFAVFDDCRDAQSFFGNLENDLADVCLRRYFRAVRTVQHVAHAKQQFFTECAARMVFREIVGGKTTQFHQAYRYGIAHDELRRRTGSRREVDWVGFCIYRRIQDEVGVFGQERRRVARHRNKRVAKAFQDRYEHFDFRAVAAFGNADDHISRLYHAQISVNGFGCVQKHRWRSGGVHCGHDFLCNDGALADSGHDEPAFGVVNQVNGLRKVCIDKVYERCNSFTFSKDDAFCRRRNFFLITQCRNVMV